MAFKLVTLLALVAAANAGLIASYNPQISYAAAPLAAKAIDADFDPNPQYSYSYDVQDSLTGDYKQQHESRNGDIVEGSYSLVEADGSRRIVDYTADPQNGFNAVIRKEAGYIKAAALPAHPAPLLAKLAPAPIHYAQPAPIHYAPSAPKIAAYAHAPAVYAAAPAIAKIAAPALSYAAPITHVSYSTPLFSYSH